MGIAEPKIFIKSKNKKKFEIDSRFTNEETFRIRVRDPRGVFIRGSYFTVPVSHIKFDGLDSGISLILARKVGTQSMRVQSLAFNRNPVSIDTRIWTPKEARAWVKSNKNYLMDFGLDLKDYTEEKLSRLISTAPSSL